MLVRMQTHDVTEEEVTVWESNRCRNCGPIITGSREGRLLQSDAITEVRELLTELLEIAYSGIKTQEEVLVLLGGQISKTASYICKSPCFALRAHFDVIDNIFYVYGRAQLTFRGDTSG